MSDFKDKKRPFIVIESFIMELTDLNITEKTLLSYLYRLVISGRDCEMSNKYLAWVFMLSDRQIRRLFTSLEQKKYIARQLINETKREIFVTVTPTKGKITQLDNHSGQDVQTDKMSEINPGHISPTPQDKRVLPPRTKTSYNKKEYKKDDKKEPLQYGTVFSDHKYLKEIQQLLIVTLKDPKISLKQTEELLIHHTKDVKVNWSIDNYAYHLDSPQGETIEKKFHCLLSHIKKKGYFDDNRSYHTVDQDRSPCEMTKPKLQFDNPITKLTPKKDNSKKDDVLMYECFTKWQRKAHVSITEKYNTAQSLLEFFKNMVFPTFSRQEINILLGNY